MPKNLGGHVTLATPPFKKFLGVMRRLSLETCTYKYNLKCVALTIFVLLAFNAQKFQGSRDPGHAPFRKIMGHVPTFRGNICVKFEVLSFNRFGAISI